VEESSLLTGVFILCQLGRRLGRKYLHQELFQRMHWQMSALIIIQEESLRLMEAFILFHLASEEEFKKSVPPK
jgi:hypothetical protein